MKRRKDDEAGAFMQRLNAYRMVASIKQPKQIEIALSLKHQLGGVFLLTGHIGVIKGYIDLFQSHGLPVFLHLEKIGGLSTDMYGLDYLANVIQPSGVITTKTNVVKIAKKLNLFTIQRFFLVDSEGIENISKSFCQIQPDIVEVMPARTPEMIGVIRNSVHVPIITGGLLFDRNQAMACLEHGAAAVSSSRPELWRETFSVPEAKVRSMA